MEIALLLFRFFPHGGLQRDALGVARRLAAAGEQVRFLVGDWAGPRPDGIAVEVVGRRGWTNHGADADFARRAVPASAGAALRVGFNRMPGLDVYYAADPCLAALLAARPAWQRLTPRNRLRLRFERAVFGPAAATRSLLLSPGQRSDVERHYGTPPDRLLLLPPGIGPDRRRPADAPARRAAARAGLGVAEDELLLLALGSNFATKGVDRTLAALAALPAGRRGAVRLAVAGRGKERPLRRQAARLGIADRLLLLGPRDDVPALLLAADLLVHPARLENTGQALLEALVAGLPVLTTANCGFAPIVQEAGAGLVLPEPFAAAALAQALAAMLDPARRAACAAAGLAFAGRVDLHGGLDAAAAAIRRWAAQR
jgi:UDP-glucose:(heptosyl)LPS alpha-1,3-glucosyltransferase